MATDLIHRDEFRCRAEAWAEDVFAGEPDNCKYNSLLHLIDDSEVVGAADVETEKLIEALRHNYAPDLHVIEDMQNAADALERLTADNTAKDAEIERLKKHAEDLRLDYCDLLANRDLLQAENDILQKRNKHNMECYFAERDNAKRLQAELDAAVEDMNHIAREIEKCDWTLAKDGEKVGSLHLGRCAVCNHRYCDEEILDGCHFEWRGKEHD